MKILLKQATILDRDSAYFNQQKDVLIKDGKIAEIANHIDVDKATIITSKELCISQSWMDLKADFCDPGNEFDEDIKSGLATASDGGFGHVFLVPTTTPVIDNKAQVNYINTEHKGHITDLHPMGTVTKSAKGESLSEMYDMYKSGVSLFSDNTHPLSSGILLRALLYLKDFGGKLISFPQDESICNHGQVNEGIASLKTGLKAMPIIGEVIRVQRDLNLLEYTEGALHFTGVSSKAALELIRKAKKKGLNVTCDVHVHQLLFNELEVLNYDTNHKVFPPYRTEEDRLALWKGIEDGTIDCIVSNHQPKIIDKKDIEFDNAEFGSITLQSFYSSLLKNNKEQHLDFIDKISSQPRKIINQKENTSINEGNSVDITIFDPTIKWSYDETSNLSKSKNSPFLGQELTGKAIGIIKTDQSKINTVIIE